MKNAVVLVNPSYRISHIVKLSKKYNFVPICIFTMPNNKFANFESTIPNILNLNKNVIFYKTYLEKCSIEEFAKKISLTYKINAIVPYEDDLLFSEKLAKLLNVACNDFNTIDVRKDKYKFNELLAKHNVRSAKQMMVEKNTKTKDIVKFFNNTFPIVLKPIDGAASISVYICKDEKMINEILNNSNGNAFKSKFVAQEFIGGDEYMVNFVTYKSKHFLTNICKYDRAVVDGHVLYVGLQYITKHDKLWNSLEKYGIDVLKASGVNCGTTHLEVKVDKNGPVLIECNWRLQGAHDFIDEPMVGKCSLYELALFSYWPELKQSKEFFENYSISKVYKNNLFVVAIIAYENGYLTKYTIDENKKLWPSYNSFNPCVSQNQHFSKSTDLMTIIGEVELKSKSIKIIERDRDLILKISKDDHKKIWI